MVTMPTTATACVNFLVALDAHMFTVIPVTASTTTTRIRFSDFSFEKATFSYESLKHAFTVYNVITTTEALLRAFTLTKSVTVIAQITDASFVEGRVFDKTASVSDETVIGSRLALQGNMSIFHYESDTSSKIICSNHIPFNAMVERTLDQVSKQGVSWESGDSETQGWWPSVIITDDISRAVCLPVFHLKIHVELF